MPETSALSEYNKTYFQNAHGGHSQDAVSKAFFYGIARIRMEYIVRSAQELHRNISNIVEIGPGRGYLAHTWLQNYRHTYYQAIETDVSCHSTLEKQGVNLIDAENAGKNVQVADLLILSHVLEHVANPVQFIIDMSLFLRPGGIIFIEVPCRDWEYKTIDEPHLLFFDKQPMHYLLTQTGFNIIHSSYHGQINFRLLKSSKLQSLLQRIRTYCLRIGLVFPFARIQHGLEQIYTPLERAVLKPFQAHIEHNQPSRWLRVIAVKVHNL